jgi:hypothetical protein
MYEPICTHVPFMAGSFGGGGPTVSSGTTFPAWIAPKQQAHPYSSTPVTRGTDKLVSVLQNITRNCVSVYSCD